MPPPASPPAPPAPTLRPSRVTGAALVLLACALVLAGSPSRVPLAAEDGALRDALREWRRVAHASDLGTRVQAVRALAATRCAKALDKCIAICASPGAHPEHLRELIAPILAQTFGGPAFARTWLHEFRARLAAPEHAWLAWHVFRRWVEGGQEFHVQLAARGLAGQPFHRAAAFDALAARPPSERSLRIARSTLDSPHPDRLERLVVGEAAASLLKAGLVPKREALEVRDIEPLLTLLEHPASSPHTRGVVARLLAQLLDSDVAWTDAPSWRQQLEDIEAEALLRREGYASGTRTTPTFLGLRARGRNVCYVIDVSGSMNLPVFGVPTGTRRPGGRRGPATGRPPANGKRDPWRGLEELPWTRIHTRLDLVKEALKASLASLDRDQLFAIVTFATDAHPLSSTRRPIPATPRNVARAAKAVDALSASGSTNLHRGMEIAFGFDAGGVETRGAFVDPSHLEDGFDTVFVLTDGSPNVDSYGTSRGLGAPSGFRRGRFRSSSLYAQDDAIVESVRRQNLFRRAEIHCIGMGASPRKLLERLAAVGGGKARFLGR